MDINLYYICLLLQSTPSQFQVNYKIFKLQCPHQAAMIFLSLMMDYIVCVTYPRPIMCFSYYCMAFMCGL